MKFIYYELYVRETPESLECRVNSFPHQCNHANLNVKTFKPMEGIILVYLVAK